MQDDLGYTALGVACAEGHRDVAAILIKRGATVDYLNKVRQYDHHHCGIDRMVCSV